MKQSVPLSRLSNATRTVFGVNRHKADALAPKSTLTGTRDTSIVVRNASRKSRRGVSKFLVGCTLGLSAVSSFAITIDQVISDMSSKSEAMVIDPRYSWQYEPAVTMYAPRGDAIPNWWTGNRPEWTYNVLTWFTAYEAQGNGATNSRIQITNLRFYILSQSSRTWKQFDAKAAPGVDLWKYPFTYDSANPGVKYESSGGISVKPKYPNFHHGYGNSVNINPQDVRAVFVAMEYRLVVDDPSKPDDRNSAKYVVDAGGDYWPGNGQGSWSLGYAPGMGNGRMMLATKDWRTATMLVPNPNYGSTMEEIRKNPPPLPAGSGTVTTTTTTKATTTTTGAYTTTTQGITTTTGSTTTTTLAPNTGTSENPVSTSAYAALTAKHSGKCIDVSAWSTANGGAIVQYGCHGRDNQKWALRDMGGAQYQVTSRSSGKCLDTRGSTANGAAVVQYDCANSAQQLWTRRTAASGHSQLVNTASGKCLNVRGYSAGDGAVIEQNVCTNSDSQQWALPVSAPQALTAKHSGKCLDLNARSTANGMQMQQWSCNGGTNQQWLFKDTGNARYQIISRSSGKCLDVKNGATTDGTAIQQMDCRSGVSKQLWTFQPEAGGYNKLKSVASGKCMDVVAISTADGAKLTQFSCNVANGDNQRWMIK